MKFSSIGSITALLCVAPNFAQIVCPINSGHTQGPCEVDVESPEIVITPAPTEFPTSSPSSTPTITPTMNPTDTPSLMPTLTPTSTPSITPSLNPTGPPTLNPSSNPTVVPTIAPSGPPSFVPTSKPSVSPTEYTCVTQNGFFGDINSEAVRTIEYGYEIEASTSGEYIATEVVGLVETAVTDSILSELFADCAVRRQLRVTRRLEITGVTRNPEDIIIDEVACGTIGEGNECVVVDGALSVYATNEESAAALEEVILAAIKANMDSGTFDNVEPSVVRVTYTEFQSDTPSGSESDGNDAVVQNNNTPVLVGSLVGAGVLMAAILAIAYKRRNSAQEDETTTDLGDNPSAAF